MRYSLAAALLGALSLSACAVSQGNPNGSPYANEPGGTIAVKAEVLGTASYDPYGKPAPFSDMQIGQPAYNPPPPLNVRPAR